MPSLRPLTLLATIAAALSTIACTGTAPLKLKRPTAASHLELAEAFSYEVAPPMTNSLSLNTLAAGTYQAVGADDDGTYFLGSADCLKAAVVKPGWVYQESAVGKTISSSCGIYVPLKADAPAKVFVVIGNGKPRPAAAAPRTPTVPDHMIDNAVPRTAPNAIIPVAVGAGLAHGLIHMMADAEQGNYSFLPHQPEGSRLRDALRLKPLAGQIR